MMHKYANVTEMGSSLIARIRMQNIGVRFKVDKVRNICTCMCPCNFGNDKSNVNSSYIGDLNLRITSGNVRVMYTPINPTFA